jgi:hypothetical protein
MILDVKRDHAKRKLDIRQHKKSGNDQIHFGGKERL